MKLGSVLTAMVTPFKPDGSLDLEQAARLAAHLVEIGNDGVVVAGTTGESPTLTDKEKLDLFRAVVDAIGGRATVIAGTGDYNTEHSIHLTKEAEKLGVDGIMAVVPYYNKPPQEGLYRHFRAIAESTSLPVMLYNVPGRTSSNLLPETVERLAEIDNIVAIKEASGNMDQVSEIRRRTPAEFMIYAGDDSLTLPILALGGTGVVSVAGHLVGRRIRARGQLLALLGGRVDDPDVDPELGFLPEVGQRRTGRRVGAGAHDGASPQGVSQERRVDLHVVELVAQGVEDPLQVAPVHVTGGGEVDRLAAEVGPGLEVGRPVSRNRQECLHRVYVEGVHQIADTRREALVRPDPGIQLGHAHVGGVRHFRLAVHGGPHGRGRIGIRMDRDHVLGRQLAVEHVRQDAGHRVPVGAYVSRGHAHGYALRQGRVRQHKCRQREKDDQNCSCPTHPPRHQETLLLQKFVVDGDA